jgi:hypothetical protein
MAGMEGLDQVAAQLLFVFATARRRQKDKGKGWAV